jgi:hypothetical protein
MDALPECCRAITPKDGFGPFLMIDIVTYFETLVIGKVVE